MAETLSLSYMYVIASELDTRRILISPGRVRRALCFLLKCIWVCIKLHWVALYFLLFSGLKAGQKEKAVFQMFFLFKKSTTPKPHKAPAACIADCQLLTPGIWISVSCVSFGLHLQCISNCFLWHCLWLPWKLHKIRITHKINEGCDWRWTLVWINNAFYWVRQLVFHKLEFKSY